MNACAYGYKINRLAEWKWEIDSSRFNISTSLRILRINKHNFACFKIKSIISKILTILVDRRTTRILDREGPFDDFDENKNVWFLPREDVPICFRQFNSFDAPDLHRSSRWWNISVLRNFPTISWKFLVQILPWHIRFLLFFISESVLFPINTAGFEFLY